ncbi:MAG TPA: hypothetical protein QF514_03430, partial [Candidatus Thalassarchaeaceae archaeon]|nr:hypothetical protein [Candidatus Thalassarchaeaceae archaeon]
DGELDLHIHVDAENSIDEINENNTLTLPVAIQPAPEAGFLSLTVIGGIAMLLLFGALMFGLAVMFLRGSRYEDEDEWEDEDEFDERGDTTSADTLLDDYVED